MLHVGENILFKNTVSMLYSNIENHLELDSRSFNHQKQRHAFQIF